jgi:acyl-CoA thioesterase
LEHIPTKIVETMMLNDHFSKWLGIEIIEIKEGLCSLKMQVRKEMLNGFHILHGGIYYSLADSALAFASNSYNIKSVSIETSISHIKSCVENDVLIATTKLISNTKKTGIYTVDITCKQLLVASFKGTVYKTSNVWF